MSAAVEEQALEIPTGSYKHPCIYRLFDSQGSLLYIGASMMVLQRMAQHTAFPWYKEIASVRLEHHASRQDAFLAEKAAILAEKPKYNIEHTPKISASRNRYAKPEAEDLEQLLAKQKRVAREVRLVKYRKERVDYNVKMAKAAASSPKEGPGQ